MVFLLQIRNQTERTKKKVSRSISTRKNTKNTFKKKERKKKTKQNVIFFVCLTFHTQRSCTSLNYLIVCFLFTTTKVCEKDFDFFHIPARNECSN